MQYFRYIDPPLESTEKHGSLPDDEMVGWVDPFEGKNVSDSGFCVRDDSERAGSGVLEPRPNIAMPASPPNKVQFWPVTSAGWQVTLCDPIRHVISGSGVVISITNCYIRVFTLVPNSTKLVGCTGHQNVSAALRLHTMDKAPNFGKDKVKCMAGIKTHDRYPNHYITEPRLHLKQC